MKGFKTTKKAIGSHAEAFVISYLTRHGVSIIAQNYQKRFGEIDIIAQKRNTIAFVEVKYRAHAYCYISEIIPRSKQLKVIKTAKSFLTAYSLVNYVIRFDVAFVQKDKKGYTLNYISNAFTE